MRETLEDRAAHERTHGLTLAAPPPNRTPMKKPAVTQPQAASARCDGSFLYARNVMATVNGRTRPRATCARCVVVARKSAELFDSNLSAG